jgi:signal peptidase I, bacterial type
MRICFICTVAALCLFALGCGSYRAYHIPTPAMEPTIKVGDYAVADEDFYKSEKPIERFDIVVHKAPLDENTKKAGTDENSRFVFRVIGLGGEKVEIKKGKVYINDEPLNEKFQKIDSEDDFGPVVVPENEFFLLGDNRPNSYDSRYWKPSTIKRENIFGKIIKIY